MANTKASGRLKYQIAPILSEVTSLHQYEAAFRRWLGRELLEGRISNQQAMEQFNLPIHMLSLIRKQYNPEVVSLVDMTAAEKQQLEDLQKRLALLEKQLEDARVRNIALETLVDVAEKKFNIPIRKKPGAKQ